MKILKNHSPKVSTGIFSPFYVAAMFVFLVGQPQVALAEGDAVAGEKLFKKCSACHKIGPESENGIGPSLTGVVGRKAATSEGFNYGKSIKAARDKGLIWTEDTIFDYLANPKKFLRAYLDNKKAKSKMKFKLKKEGQRRDVIAYLAAFSPKEAMMDDMSGKVCVTNDTDAPLLFAAESTSGGRETKTLEKTQTLCIATADEKGTVGVFENADAIEGCSRLAAAGKVERLVSYTSFDNCEWAQ